MTQRTWAAVLAVPLFVALGYVRADAAAVRHLRTRADHQRARAKRRRADHRGRGHPTYRDAGAAADDDRLGDPARREAGPPRAAAHVVLARRRVYPYAIQYGGGGSQQQDTQEGQVEMIASQDSAIAAALRKLGYQVSPVLESPQPSRPDAADGKLEVRDVIRRFNGTRVTAAPTWRKLITAVPAGTRSR
jgi:PDZ domain-containing protein